MYNLLLLLLLLFVYRLYARYLQLHIRKKEVCGAYNIIIIIIVLFDDAEDITTETHFLCTFNLTSRISIAASFVILPYKQYFINQFDM
jgi:hypothetical protein